MESNKNQMINCQIFFSFRRQMHIRRQGFLYLEKLKIMNEKLEKFQLSIIKHLFIIISFPSWSKHKTWKATFRLPQTYSRDAFGKKKFFQRHSNQFFVNEKIKWLILPFIITCKAKSRMFIQVNSEKIISQLFKNL